MKRLYDAFQLVKSIFEKACEEQRAKYDARAEKLEYQVGDKVLLEFKAWKRGTSRKLNPRNKGPYRVRKVNSNLTVEIQGCAGKQTQLVQVNRYQTSLGDYDMERRTMRPIFLTSGQAQCPNPLPSEVSKIVPEATASEEKGDEENRKNDCPFSLSAGLCHSPQTRKPSGTTVLENVEQSEPINEVVEESLEIYKIKTFVRYKNSPAILIINEGFKNFENIASTYINSNKY